MHLHPVHWRRVKRLTGSQHSLPLIALREPVSTIESKPVEAVVYVDAEARRPSLYVLAVGVADYRDHALRLSYAAADARAMAAALERQGERLFNAVTVQRLLEREVTDKQRRERVPPGSLRLPAS